MDQGLRHLTGRAKSDVNILIIRCAPRHAGVVDEDVNLLFLGLDGLDEVVAPSLGLDIRGRQSVLAALLRQCWLTLRSATTYSQVPGPVLFSFSET